MATVATLTKNVRLSEETIRRCLNIIENSYLNPQDTKRSANTLAEIFYRNGGFDTTINREFSESAIKKILKGQWADELSVREFLFFLKLIPQTDPKGGIDEFLHKPLSKTPSTVSPYALSRENLNFDGSKISLLDEASQEIKKRMKDLRLSQTSIGEQCNLTHTSIHDTLIRRKLWRREPFQKILEAFLAQGVITLPEGETLDNLLSTDQEPPHTLTEGDIDFEENKVFLLKQGREGIKDVIVKRGLSTQTIAKNLGIHTIFWRALRGEKVTLKTLEKILKGLIDQNIIVIPEGQTLKQLLDPKSEPSYTPTDDSVSTGANCAAIGGGGEIPELTAALLQSPPPAHIDHSGGR